MGSILQLTRRDFLKITASGVAIMAMLRRVSAQLGKIDRLNIVVILADDLAFYEIGCYGGKNVKTPNIDRLAAEGMRFTSAFASEAMCVPIRSSLYTGLFPVRHGACHNHQSVKVDTRSVPHYLRPLGYRVGLTGKLHVKPKESFPFEIVPGFEPNCVALTAGYSMDGVREFMTRDSVQPFCLFVCSTLPHAPWTAGDAAKYPPEKLILPPVWADTPDTRIAFSKYCAEVEALDREVGDVVRILEETGQKDKTVLMFCGEQGAQFPGAKWTLFEPGIRSAVIARWPGRIKAGVTSTAIIQYEDVLPTLMELAGGSAERNLDGVSFAGVLTGNRTDAREYAYGVHNNVPEGRPYPVRSIRSKKYKLILNLVSENDYHEKHLMDIDRENYWKSWVVAAKTDLHTAKWVNRYTRRPAVELYDVEKDPWELENIAERAEMGNVRRELEGKLREWMNQQGDAGADLDQEPVPGTQAREKKRTKK